MTRNEQVIYGVRIAQKERVPFGCSCAHPSDKMTYKLVNYEDGGETAVLCFEETEKRFPASEVFDPNTALNWAFHALVSTKYITTPQSAD